MVIALFLLLIIVGSLLGIRIYTNHQASISATATASAIAAMAQTNTQATGTAQATSTANANATATATSPKLVLDDPMADNRKGAQWEDRTASCFFSSGSFYHVVGVKSGSYNICIARSTNYSNFRFETQMIINSGGDSAAGGLVFRANANNGDYYRLSIDTTGHYSVWVVTGNQDPLRPLIEGSVPPLSFGASNTLKLVANGNQYMFFVNGFQVGPFSDNTFRQGQIGFDAAYGTNLTFRDTKVWLLS